MKNSYKIILIILLASIGSLATAQTGERQKNNVPQAKEERIDDDFQRTKEIVESNRFKIVLSIATPLNGLNVKIDSTAVTVNDSVAKAGLPYYSSNYSYPQTGAKGIVFNNQILNRSVKIKGKKGKRSIAYQFEVVGTLDSYKLKTDIQYDGSCYLYINSTRRSSISYIGRIYPL